MTRAPKLLSTLILFTSLFMGTQVLLLLVNAATTHFFDTAVSSSITFEILQSKIFVKGLLQLILNQVFIYALLISFVWYFSYAIDELFSLNKKMLRPIAIVLLLASFIGILSGNYLYAPHSFFANLLRDSFSSPLKADILLRFSFIMSCWILSIAAALASIEFFSSLFKKKAAWRHILFFSFLTCAILLYAITWWLARPNISNAATTTKPNIILIGIDAVRPDFLGFYNKAVTTTPTIDNFLKSSISFSNAYTELPRTFPSWTSILTGTYPKHNKARGNNTDLNELNLTSSLPKLLHDEGYETIYSTDDTRFNNTNSLFGFDQVITPPMGLNDFLIGTINDFPFSNLLVSTPLGRILFPYNYANHGAFVTYEPNNFLQLLKETLHKRENKPLFMAVHFTITHWPFFWFNDKIPPYYHELYRYQMGIAGVDTQLNQFFSILQANKLLDHAIVVLLSDHGVALGLPGDRFTTEAKYHGNKANIKKLTVMKYGRSSADSLDFQHDYGIDTSYGYGGDILSLTQYHTLLAFKGYGVNLGTPHQINKRALLLDIPPTLLDQLNITHHVRFDGFSLKPLFTTSETTFQQRPLFFESSFTIEEIEKEGISLSKVLSKAVKLYRMDPNTGLVFIKTEAEKGINQNKQVAIFQNDWLLARLPESVKFSLDSKNPSGFAPHILPSRWLLANIRTGEWTLELDTRFAKNAPLQLLMNQLHQFYGKEIEPN